jgi:hypothetical protein
MATTQPDGVGVKPAGSPPAVTSSQVHDWGITLGAVLLAGRRAEQLDTALLQQASTSQHLRRRARVQVSLLPRRLRRRGHEASGTTTVPQACHSQQS